MKKNMISFVLSVVLLLTPMPVGLSAKAQTDAPEGFILAEQNDGLSLYYNEQTYAVAVRENRSGYIWYSYLPESEYPEGELNDEIRKELSSLLILTYSQANIATDKVVSSSLNALKPSVKTESVPNGFAFIFYFEQLNFQLRMEFSIQGGRLEVHIPNEGIQEGVGTKEQLEQQKEKLMTFIGDIRKIIAGVESDRDLPDAYKKGVKEFYREADNFESGLKQIKSAVRIDSAADQLAAFIKKMKALTLSGEASSLGIVNRIRTAEELPDAVRQRYNAVFNQLNDAFELADFAVGGLKSISVTSLVELQVLPYFGSSSDNAEGYMLYPDGSGAITRFKKNHPDFSGAYRSDVYSDDTPDMDIISLLETKGLTGTMLPVVGVQKDGAAFAATAVSGDEECFVNFCPSGYIMDVNRTFLGFRYRRKVNGGADMGSFTGSEGNFQYESERRNISPRIDYLFLADDKADYSGMANAVRELYLENGMLKKSTMLESGLPPMALDIFGGFNRRQLIFDNYLVFTNYYQAAEIINDISRHTNMQLMVNFREWTADDSLKPAPLPAFGGKKGFDVMTEMARDCQTPLFLFYNPYRVSVGMSGYKDGDLAVSNNLLIIQGKLYKQMALSPAVMVGKYRAVLDDLKQRNVNGVTLMGAGDFLYYDYNPKRLTMRADSIAYWQQALKETREKLGAAAVSGGNRYVLGTTDWLQDIPNMSSGYSYSDESVPFYQMVVHGSVPYSGKYINAFYDPAVEKLKAIEYGYTPIYSVSYNPVEYVTSFTSVYHDLRDEILALCSEYYENLSCISDQAMISHEVMGEQVKVTYANGVSVYVNYSTSNATVDGHTIKALDYVVVGGERGESFEKEILEYEAPGESDRLFVYGAVAGGILVVLLVSAGIFLAAYLRKRRG